MKNWKEYLETPKKIRLYVIPTGYVHMSGNIHFNPKSPRFKAMVKDNRFNPVFAYLVEHLQKGFLLLDTGLHPSFAEKRTGNFGWLLGRIVKVRSELGQDVITQLEKIRIRPGEIRSIILSHFHLDHASGLPLFSRDSGLAVYADEGEIRSVKAPFSLFQGYIKNHLNGFTPQAIRFTHAVPPFERVCDIMEDGSVFVIGTPGHTPGHISIILNMIGGPFLLTFDAAHRKANIDEGIPPKGDYALALKSISNIKSFIDTFPQTRTIFGHDPDQINSLKILPSYYE
jgi:glyoxylase-like metal-dependent hydrolase (beta-lactamase superfamily II)